MLTISAWQTKIGTYANSVDPDEMTHHESSHLDFFHSVLVFDLNPVCIDGLAQIQRWKSPLKKLGGEKVKIKTKWETV